MYISKGKISKNHFILDEFSLSWKKPMETNEKSDEVITEEQPSVESTNTNETNDDTAKIGEIFSKNSID